MKISLVLITCCILAIAGLHLPSFASDSHTTAQPTLYLDNLHILDINTGQVIRNRQLQIRAGKITAIKPANTSITDEYYVLHDAEGRYAVPGLIDMHVHAFDPAVFAITLSHGVTHLRLMNGVKEQLAWRDELENGRRIGSTITVSSPIISGFKNAHLHNPAHTPAEAINEVRVAKQQGYDLIKAYGNLTAPVLNALLGEAKQQQIPVAKHGPHPANEMEWNQLADLQSLEHVEDIFQGPLNYQQNREKLDETIQQLKALNTPVTPTLNIFWHLTQISVQKQSYIDSIPSEYTSPIIALEEKHNQVKRWLESPAIMAEHNKKTLAFLQEITLKLYQAEVTLLIGSDSGVLLSPHGLATHKEMELLQQAGLPIIAILRAATVNAAKALGREKQLGQIAVGYNADLILSDQNPLEDLKTLQHPDFVIKHGQLFSREALEQLRSKAIDERSLWQEMKTLLKVN